MSRGILDLLGLAATLVFAVPVALLGLRFLSRGEPLVGVAFLAIAVGMVAIEEYVLTPRDLPAALAQRVAGRVAKQPEEEE